MAITGNARAGVNAGRLDTAAAKAAADPAAQKQALMAQYRSSLPFSPEQLKASDMQVEAALYEPGRHLQRAGSRSGRKGLKLTKSK
ncbi:hypothetical protein ACFQT0_02795 [Hymenobacter humi]|uniref:Uncharacterized protein n=1 Tax=Hymenobacter humi TaxID=1411620 RepID=A0ABW2U2F1_9BACT